MDYLLQGKVLARIEGGSEFDAGALRHRSIIADPRDLKIRDFINREVKLREGFPPFAPSVPREYVFTYFDCDLDSPYMILIAQTRDAWKAKIPAVVHADDTTRIQTVTEEISPSYYQLLMAFGKASGVYMLLNTSFDRKGMPIVENSKRCY